MICETSMCKAGYKDLYHQIKGLYPNVTDLTKRIRVIVSSRIWKTGKWTKEDLLQLGFLVWKLYLQIYITIGGSAGQEMEDDWKHSGEVCVEISSD